MRIALKVDVFGVYADHPVLPIIQKGCFMQRCHWCTHDDLYIQYHDNEWGVPSRDPQHLFEMLILEGFQAGLSWWTILQKREHFRTALFQFDPERLATMNDDDITTLLQDPGIVRNRLKLRAARTNAQAWLKLNNPVELIWSITNGQPIIGHYADHTQLPATSAQAEALSRILKEKGFKFVGPLICHAYLQAIGVLMEHTMDCYRYAELAILPRRLQHP